LQYRCNTRYWAFTTLTTVGYGDISAKTNAEVVFSIFTMILGVTVYSLILSSVNAAMASFDTNAAYKQQRRNKMAEFVRNSKLPRPLAQRCHRYLEYKLAQPHSVTMDAGERDAVLAELTPGLRMQCVKFSHRDILRDIPFFDAVGDDAFTCGAVQHLRQRRRNGGSALAAEGEPVRDAFFLVTGVVRVEKGEAVLQTVAGGTRGSEFGVVAALRQGDWRYRLTCATKVEFYALEAGALRRLAEDWTSRTNDAVQSSASHYAPKQSLRSAVHKMIAASRIARGNSMGGADKGSDMSKAQFAAAIRAHVGKLEAKVARCAAASDELLRTAQAIAADL
jgi:hypothetical protein